MAEEINELDAFIRRQAYLEGYRNYESGQFRETGLLVSSVIIASLMDLGYERIGDIPKSKLNQFLSRINKRIAVLLGDFFQLKTTDLRRYMAVELQVDKRLFAAFSTRNPNAKQFSGLSSGNDLLWASIQNEPIAGTGQIPKDVFGALAASFSADLIRLIRQAWANGWSIDEFIRQLQGTKTLKQKDGLLNRLNNQYSTAVQTYIQHIGSFVLFSLGSSLFKRYEWISVLDSRTTDICLSRSGRVYDYATGPKPPAHYNCRSTIMPIVGEAVEIPTYYAWIQRQPSIVQNDILGRTRAIRLRKGELNSDDLPKFDGMKPLTRRQYGDKVNRMLTAA